MQTMSLDFTFIYNLAIQYVAMTSCKIGKDIRYQTVELKRYFIENEDGTITFTHEVSFKGRLRSVAYALLCGAFKKDLKLVVERLKEIAEAQDTEKTTHSHSE